LIRIEAFSIKSFLNLLGNANSNTLDLPLKVIFLTTAVVSTCP